MENEGVTGHSGKEGDVEKGRRDTVVETKRHMYCLGHSHTSKLFVCLKYKFAPTVLISGLSPLPLPQVIFLSYFH